jgi:glycosyltransferase involved in cell wall biosynthesis
MSQPALHIVHIGPHSLPLRHARGGAIERRILELAAAQASRGHHVTAYSAENQCSVTQFRGIELKALACRNGGLRKRFEFLIQALGDVSAADVLHFHSVPEGAVLARKINAVKVLSYDYFAWRGSQFHPVYWGYREALKKFDCLLPVSEFCRSESLRYWRLPEQGTHVFYNGVNLEQFCPDAEGGRRMRSRLGLQESPIVLYVGRVCRQKGTDVLVEAYRRLQRIMPEPRLVVAGPAERFTNGGGNRLTESIAEAGGIYLGAVEEGNLAPLYNACDVFVMPTRKDEMFGMAAAEAQACGKPVVCSRHGGLVEVVSAESGRFFPAGNAAALADELASLLRSPEQCRCLSLAACANAQRFGWARLAEEAEQIYVCRETRVQARRPTLAPSA